MISSKGLVLSGVLVGSPQSSEVTSHESIDVTPPSDGQESNMNSLDGISAMVKGLELTNIHGLGEHTNEGDANIVSSPMAKMDHSTQLESDFNASSSPDAVNYSLSSGSGHTLPINDDSEEQQTASRKKPVKSKRSPIAPAAEGNIRNAGAVDRPHVKRTRRIASNEHVEAITTSPTVSLAVVRRERRSVAPVKKDSCLGSWPSRKQSAASGNWSLR